jgi:Ca2+/Na+ antiporter
MRQALALVAGIASIIVGAELLVDGAIQVARSLQVSEAGQRMTRPEGGAFVAAYIAYLLWLTLT